MSDNTLSRRPHSGARRFILFRFDDPSGVSGVGRVAAGVLFETGKVVLCWHTQHSSIAVYDNLSDLMQIHGHDGATRLYWEDN